MREYVCAFRTVLSQFIYRFGRKSPKKWTRKNQKALDEQREVERREETQRKTDIDLI